ncbi:LemA family protein [Mycoplasma sp. HU2014]|uniref:LemA family protein n=1 Tax=Mycoplasma sp. HU2014 TaxID=1664275 RepID=UPI00067C0F13|nr:LemA family protein [Mycoplasma sp. HU2014]KNG79730.1 LemA family protein [Mycoplasma sp. HU2014]
MANQLDEINGPVFEDGREINVINKQLPITVGVGSKIFEILLWILIIPGLIFQYRKVKARNYLAQLEQKIQANASQVDNYLEQRVQVMKNLASLLSKSIDVDKDIMKSVAAYRSGIDLSKQSRTEVLQEVEHNIRGLQLQFENYPELQSHKSVREAMQQNIYLQKEITATRDIYNDSINQWNRAINEWPAKQMVAAKLGYTTKIPFATTSEIKQQARQDFFS